MAVTVNDDRKTMLFEFLWSEFESNKIEEMLFPQNGVTCHTADATY